MKIIFVSFALFISPIFAQQQNVNSELKNNSINIINETDLNSDKDEISVSIIADGSQIFFSSNKSLNSTSKIDFDIYMSKIKKNTWNTPSAISSLNSAENEIISTTNFNGNKIYTQTALSSLLDFSISNLKDENWNKPEKQTIAMLPISLPLNDEKNEKVTIDFLQELSILCKEQPRFVTIHGDKLYFSTKGLTTLGGYDIFYCTLTNGKWSKPVNMGTPINSQFDEYSYSPILTEKIAYLTSNRSGGKGGFDIYKIVFFENENNPIPEVLFGSFLISSDRKPLFSSKLTNTNFQLENYVTLYTGKSINLLNLQPVASKIEIIDIETSQVIETTLTNNKTGKFSVLLKSGKNYAVRISAEGYLFQTENLTLKSLGQNNITIQDFKMQTISIGNVSVMKNIFFLDNESNLLPNSFPEIEYIYQTLLVNPNLKIEIGSFTSNINTLNNNQSITQSRSENIVKYLISKGINQNRLIAKGYGSKKPLFSNENEFGRRQNNRIEIRILAN